MAAEKSERLLNLLIMLLMQRRYIAKERVRELLYPDSTDEAFERMFERDKDDLRALGVPIEVGQLDAYFDDEPGYRIRADEAQLPQIELTGDEAQVVGLATKVWEHARLAEATSGAVRKLTAAGVPVDVGALDVVGPRLGADEPAFDVFWEAARDRCRSWSSTTSGPAASPRPGGSNPGAWCATPAAGTPWATTSTAARSGCSGSRACAATPAALGQPAAYDVPAGVDIRDVARRLAPTPSSRARHPARQDRRGPRVPAVGDDGRGRRERPGRPVRLGPDRARPRPATTSPGEVLAHGRRRVRRGAGRAAERTWSPGCGPQPVRPGRRRGRRRDQHRGSPRAGRPAPDAGALPPQPGARCGVEEAATALGVPPQQVVKDLKVLFMCGLPAATRTT